MSAPDRPAGPAAPGPAAPARWRWWAFAAAVAVHLVVLYAPRSPGSGGLPVDKVVHAAIFAAVFWTAARAGLDRRATGSVLTVHAVVSKLVQHLVLPGREGDWTDVVADLFGVVIVTLILRVRT